MIDVSELKAYMARKGYTQKALAKEIGISEGTMLRRLKSRNFNSDEAEKIIRILGILNPADIFFAGE